MATLNNYITGEVIREATQAESEASKKVQTPRWDRESHPGEAPIEVEIDGVKMQCFVNPRDSFATEYLYQSLDLVRIVSGECVEKFGPKTIYEASKMAKAMGLPLRYHGPHPVAVTLDCDAIITAFEATMSRRAKARHDRVTSAAE